MPDAGDTGREMKGVFLDRGSLDCADLDFSRLKAALPEWEFHEQTQAQALSSRIDGAEVVVSNKVVLDAEVIRQASALRLICIAATGTNNVDLDAARAQGVAVCNVTRYATASVVEHVFGMLLMLARRLEPYHSAAIDGHWSASRQFCLLTYPIRELSGKTIGIVGYGELGQAVARLARAFGMRVLIARRPGGGGEEQGRVALDALLPMVDVLSLHCPLTPATHNLIGAHALSRLPPHALLINTARGGVVDEQALADALRSGVIAGAGIDVLSEEPPVHGNVLLQPDIPNLLITPHVAWGSREARQRLLDEVAGNIESWRQGALRNAL